MSEKFYDVILTTFLVQNFQKFAHGVLLHSSMSVQNLLLFAWKGAKLGGGGAKGDLPPLVWAGFENPGVGFIYILADMNSYSVSSDYGRGRLSSVSCQH